MDEAAPGFATLTRAAAHLWLQAPLVWLGLLVLPNAAAAFLLADQGLPSWAQALVLAAAFGLAAGPAVLAAANQWMHGTPFNGGWTRRLGCGLRGTALTLAYLLLTVGASAAGLTFVYRDGADTALLLAILLTLPLHAWFAPVLVLTTLPPDLELSAGEVLRRTGARTWLHLRVMLTVGTLLGGGIALLLWTLGLTLNMPGSIASHILEVALLCVAESLWCVLVTVSGLDAPAPSIEGRD